jgi:hypothetical protein
MLASTAAAQTTCTTDAQCADGNVCNGAERCLGGVCQPGQPLQCVDTSPCTVDSCDTLFGCQHAPVVNGTSCSDGNACNGAEVCQGGVCVAGTPVPEGGPCNTGNPCTNNDVCRSGVCVAGTIRANGSSCSDANECNGNETCQQGVCTPGTPAANGTECGDGEPCNGSDTCQSGACVHAAAPPEGSSCSDGFACNGLETCHSGVCTAGQRPSDGTSCSDGKPCNGQETCANGICRSGTPLDCDDGNQCTNDSCDNAMGGCKHTDRPDDSNCGDRDPCNGQETCQGGQCTAGTPPPAGTLCEDTNTCNGIEFCKDQKCTPGTPRPDGDSCADSSVCNGLERCQGGFCTAGTPLDCKDTNPCTVDSCDAMNGCQHTVLPNGSPCDDHNVCNGIDTCQGVTCTSGAPPACGGLACDPSAGCVSDMLIPGSKLVLRAAGKSGLVKVKVQTRDQIVTSAPPFAGTAADPVLHGGVLRLRSATGGFDQRIELPSQNWDYLRDPTQNRGFRYRDPDRIAAIRTVIVKDGRLTKIAGGGPELEASLASNPDLLEVSLILGNKRYCMGFGGDTSFDPDRRFIAQDAPAPGSCPP